MIVVGDAGGRGRAHLRHLLLLAAALGALAAAWAPCNASAAPALFTGPTNIPAGSFPFSVAVGDFNGDSDPDLAFANYVSSGVSVLLGGAGGGFTPVAGSPFPVGANPISVAVGDFNGDSDPDLAVANFHSNDVSLLLGGAGGSFTPAAGSPFAVGNLPYSVAVGDFNGDSDPDLAVANFDSDSVSVLLGGAGASFTPAAGSPFAVGVNPISIAIGDFNGDSDPDLAVANYGSGEVSILLGGAGGSFTPAAGSPLPVRAYPLSIAVGDFNGDSDPDLAVAIEDSGDISILLGGAGASFTPAAGSPVPVGSNPVSKAVSIAVGDFNGDSDPDLAVANIITNDVSILLGGAGASFTPAAGSPFAAGSFPVSVAAGDFNDDAKLDLAVASYFSNEVSILLNNSPPRRKHRPRKPRRGHDWNDRADRNGTATTHLESP